jgi:hypothetical protein
MLITKRIREEIESLIEDNELTSENIDKIANHKTDKPRTIIQRYTSIRKLLNELGKDGKNLVKVPADLVEKVSSMDSEAREAKTSFVIDEELIKNLKSIKPTTGVNTVIWIMLRSGRRINEILGDIPMKAKNKRKDCSIIVADKLLKQREKPMKSDFQLIWTDCKEWLSHLNRVRELSQDQPDLEGMLNRKIKKMDRRLSSHKLRGIYGIALWKLSGSEQNYTGFLKTALNHTDDTSAMNYNNYILADGVKFS